MPLQWLAVDLVTGDILAQMPNLSIDQSLKQIINAYSSASVKLPVVGTPPPPRNWLRCTKGLAAAFVAVDGASPVKQPLWGGVVQQRPRDGSSVLSVPLATVESVLTRRFINTTLQYPGASWGVCQVGVDLLARYIVEGTCSGTGIPLRVVMLDDGPPAPDITWKDSDNKSVYSAFTDLGFEWTCTWEWQHDPERITPVLTLGTRIGSPVTAGLGPAVTFTFPGNLREVSYVDDYTDGKGANDVMAYSTGSGSVRPQSDHQVAASLDERPTIEYRYSAGDSIVKLADLNQDAGDTLAVLADGSTAITLTALYGAAPAYGSRWSIGDDIGYSIKGPQFPDEPSGVVRAIGVSFDQETFSPLLAGQAA